MKQGYLSELKGRQEDLENSKGLLETFYMDPTSEQDLTDDKKAEFQKSFTELDSILVSYSGTLKSVKLAIESQQHWFVLQKFLAFDFLYSIHLDPIPCFPRVPFQGTSKTEAEEQSKSQSSCLKGARDEPGHMSTHVVHHSP